MNLERKQNEEKMQLQEEKHQKQIQDMYKEQQIHMQQMMKFQQQQQQQMEEMKRVNHQANYQKIHANVIKPYQQNDQDDEPVDGMLLSSKDQIPHHERNKNLYLDAEELKALTSPQKPSSQKLRKSIRNTDVDTENPIKEISIDMPKDRTLSDSKRKSLRYSEHRKKKTIDDIDDLEDPETLTLNLRGKKKDNTASSKQTRSVKPMTLEL